MSARPGQILNTTHIINSHHASVPNPSAKTPVIRISVNPNYAIIFTAILLVVSHNVLDLFKK